MLKKTHMAVGTTLTSMAALSAGVKITPAFILAAAFGTILSDMDHPGGAINNRILLVKNNLFKAITYAAFAIALLYYGPKYFDRYLFFYIAPALLVIAFSHHRGITHSLLGLTGVWLILSLINHRYGVNIIFPCVVGMSTHILLDMLNPEGVELLAPYKRNFRFPLTITTGSIWESLLFFCFSAGFVYIGMEKLGLKNATLSAVFSKLMLKNYMHL